MQSLADLVAGLQINPNLEESLKQLRVMCTNSEQQSQIGALVQKDNVLGMLVGRLSEATEKERQAPLESFFLQFLANFVTASPVNSSTVVHKLLMEDAQLLPLLTRLQSTEKNCKFMHVFIHNLLHSLKPQYDLHRLLAETQVSKLLKLVFDGLHSERQQHPLEQSNEQLTAIFEWRCSIIKLLFDYPKKQQQPSTVQVLLELCPTKQIELLHLLSLLLEKIISSQSTPSLIKERHPTIQHINEMYVKTYSHGFQLSLSDVEYLLDLFANKFIEFKLRSAERLTQLTVQHIGGEEPSFQLLIQLTHIFCSVTFLGGYNQLLQKEFEEHLQVFCDFFELTYLMYSMARHHNNIRTTFSEVPSEEEGNIKLSKEAQERTTADRLEQLQKVLKVNHLEIPTVANYFTSNLNSKESIGSIIRLLTNLIHINPHNQRFFEINFKYLYACMSLTHIDPEQQTMRQWALLFIRNVCEVSEQLRNRIQSLKVGVKME